MRQNLIATVTGRTHPQTSSSWLVQRSNRLASRLQLLQHCCGIRQQYLTALRQDHTLAQARKHWGLQLGFQTLDLMTQRRLREVQFAGGFGEATGLDNRRKGQQLTGVQAIHGAPLQYVSSY